ncbi:MULTISPECIES: FAD-binding oxidoreductase [Microbacterium]|jgi:FAD/FMN-containing dehydrogenase|uniref:FAD-binding oxidoreductase n=1 Tax=Microbacterium TaxID=33882 RepID=UPI001E3C4B21|nr:MULTISPECIES: FAD-binding oxidoreductase [Microbacterium]MBZ6370904.1 FAD-binding oxidoreductase [Microbacterium hominis]MCC9053950.1 FAD-binding oxidoreductase [Microbacterium sp. F2E]
MPHADLDQATIDALATELRELLGADAVSDEPQALDRASIDGSHLSPVIAEQLPLGRAQLVCYPATAEDIAASVGAAVRHGVPITPRGKGTANYGQTLPMAGGLVLDTSRARKILEVGDGWLRAEAGATMIAIEQAAIRSGQQVLQYPSTAQSTVGGFVSGGSGGTGSIAHGMIHTGFVTALDVVHAVPDATLIHVEGEATEPYLHRYGTVGVIATVTVRLEPLQEWRAFFASFDDFHDLLSVIRAFPELEPTPRLVSGDLPTLAEALPADPAIFPGRASLRAILDADSIAAATALVEAAGGRVDDVREGAQACIKLSMTSYNHPIEWLQKAYPNTYFHVEVWGDAIIDRIDELHEVYDGGMLHIEAQQGRPIGMLAGVYHGADEVYAGLPKIEALGVGWHNPHQWYVDYEPAATIAFAAETDPQGLMNPGKLVAPGTFQTGSQM